MTRYASWHPKGLNTVGMWMVALVVLSACGTTSSNSGQSQQPIKIGVSVSLSGDFSADGKATEQGYQLWADTVNKNGGLLGRQVKLDILSYASSTTQVVTNYQKLITQNHDDLVFGPYSTLLTNPASNIANRYKYAMIEGSGGGPSIFNRGLHNIFDVTQPVVNLLVSFTQYVKTLPAAERPQSAAYATEDDPFTQPQVDLARSLLEKAGIKTALNEVYPAETTDFTPIAQKVIASNAQIVIFGSMLPDIIAYVQAFKQQHYNPKAIIATAGPDQGAQFTGAIGGANSAEGIFVPNSWYPESTEYQNQQMVNDYIAKYGGTAADISADTPEAYSVGQVVEQAVNKIHSIDNTALMNELHSGDTFQSVQGPVKFDATGQNIAAVSYLFQWQKGALVPVYPAASAKASPEYPKPAWS